MTGNSDLDKILLMLNGAVVLAATGLVVFAHTQMNPAPTAQDSEFGNLIENSVNEYQKPPVVLDEILVNLYSREARLRFLNTQMNIILFEEADREIVTQMKPFIFDILIDIGGNMRPSELNSVTGRLILEERIKNKFNEFSKKKLIKKILFTKFIIQ